MNSLLAFSPILALVAFLSAEVAAESYTSYKLLKQDGFVDGFDYQWTVTVEPPYTVSTKGDMEGCTSKQLDNCPMTPATWDNKDTIDVFGTIPAGVQFPPGQKPKFIQFKMCFAVPSTLDRKWRKFNELFKKDNSCKQALFGQVDWKEGPFNTTMKIKSVTATGLYTIRAYVTCEGAAASTFCHVVNVQPDAAAAAAANKVYFTTEVMDSRPTNLFVAVIICSLIGPILLIAFLIYERGILAKQA